MNIFVPIPVTDIEPTTMHLREMIAEAHDGDTDIRYELSRSNGAMIFEVTKPDGTRRKQILKFADLVAAWAVAIDVDEEEVPA